MTNSLSDALHSPVQITVLGSGTSTGVPLIGCQCAVCQSSDLKNKRLRASVWIQTQGKSILIDTSTDLRQQALRSQIPRVDAVLYTHPHADHLHGIDELRSFNFVQRESIPAYGNAWSCRELRHKFPYIFQDGKGEGGGLPQLTLHEIDASQEFVEVQGIKVQPLPVPHGSMECVGYRIHSMAYLTDCSSIPSQTLERMTGLEVLILDCVRIAPHPTHLHLEESLRVIEELRPGKAYLTHLGHEFDYATWSEKLPKNVFLAYDGLEIRI